MVYSHCFQLGRNFTEDKVIKRGDINLWMGLQGSLNTKSTKSSSLFEGIISRKKMFILQTKHEIAVNYTCIIKHLSLLNEKKMLYFSGWVRNACDGYWLKYSTSISSQHCVNFQCWVPAPMTLIVIMLQQ